MSVVLDYSMWRTTGNALRAAGVTGVCRYIAPAAWGWPKAITTTELLNLRQAGVSVLFNFEHYATDHTGGYQGGVTNGKAASQAMAELNVPREVPVFFSYDTDIQPGTGDWALAEAYARGVRDGLGGRQPEAYAEGALIEHLASKGLITRGWLSESTGFPGSGAGPTPHTVLQQKYGLKVPGFPGDYDVNFVIKDDWGQWPRPDAPPVPAPLPKELDMKCCSRIDSSVRGRVACLSFDLATKSLIGFNGPMFDPNINPKVWQVVAWPQGNPTGVTCTAKLLLATNGELEYDESPDGGGAVILAKGDGGTFGIPYANARPTQQNTVKLDYADIAAHLTAQVGVK